MSQCQTTKPKNGSEKKKELFEKKRKMVQWKFLPTLEIAKIDCISWENILGAIHTADESICPGLSKFYSDCRKRGQ